MRVSEIRVKRIRVNQGLGVCLKLQSALKSARCAFAVSLKAILHSKLCNYPTSPIPEKLPLIFAEIFPLSHCKYE